MPNSANINEQRNSPARHPSSRVEELGITRGVIEQQFITPHVMDQSLFKQGIVYMVMVPADLKKTDKAIKPTPDNHFTFGQRIFTLHHASFGTTLMAPLVAYYYPLTPKLFEQSWPVLLRTDHHLKKIYYPLRVEMPHKKKSVLYTTVTLLGDSQDHAAWNKISMVKGNRQYLFNGFHVFVTALCMFGSTLKGMNNFGNARPLVKHSIPFFQDEHVVSMRQSLDNNIYETLCFNEFKIYLRFMKNLACKDTPSKIICHVPWADYLIFGIDLYCHGKIKIEALGQFIKMIWSKKKEYVQKLHNFARNYNIVVEVLSPLENLFNPELLEQPLSDADMAKNILNTLQIKENDIKENGLVYHCLEQIITNEICQSMQTLWITHMQKILDFIQPKGKKTEQNLNTTTTIAFQYYKNFGDVDIEKLLEVANIMMIAYAVDDEKKYREHLPNPKNRSSYTVCSILPVSESPIQHTFQQLFPNTSPVVGLNILDPIICPTTPANPTGTMFYSEELNTSHVLQKLIVPDSSRNSTASIVSQSRHKFARSIFEEDVLVKPPVPDNLSHCI